MTVSELQNELYARWSPYRAAMGADRDGFWVEVREIGVAWPRLSERGFATPMQAITTGMEWIANQASKSANENGGNGT